MGACYSTTGGARRDKHDKGDEDEGWWKSKRGSEINRTSTFVLGGSVEERLLHNIPGRLFGNGSCNIASLHTQQGKKGTNQDAMIVWEKFNSSSDATFCGVFDGHGPYGHMVAKKVRDSLPVLLSTKWMDTTNTHHISDNSNTNESIPEEELFEEYWCEQSDDEEKETIPEKYSPLKKCLLKSFKLIDKELKNHPPLTVSAVDQLLKYIIFQGQDLVIGNLGDSRAVLGTRDEHNSLVPVQLTVDLKPNLPREAARIQQFKGRVFALQDEPEVSRIWLPNSDSPGLAMARAFGDFCLKDFGLISVPHIFYHRINDGDEFVILATDGVWDVVSNKEAVDIVAGAPSRSTAARALVDCATRSWKLKYPTSKNDDCAVVCLFLDQNSKTVAKEVKTHETVGEIVGDKENVGEKRIGESKRSLAECISSCEDDDWSALEGVTRVNSLLSIPRFLSVDRRSTNWRKSSSKI
ncbi:hypothetical protein LXL04_016102 [Taraxacum kok-saghyz]